MVRGGFGERERLKGKAPMELSDESSTHAVIISSDSDCVRSVHAVQSRDPPQAIVKPTDAFGRPSVHGVGTSIHGERQLHFGFEVLTPHPNLMGVTGQGRKRGKRQGYPADTADTANTECGCCAQWGTGMDACEGEASVDNEFGTHMESCEGETSTCSGWVCCCSDDQLGEPIQFAEGPLLCYTCLGRITEESTYGESEASNSLPSMDTSSCVKESFPGSQLDALLSSSGGDDAVVPVFQEG